MRRPPSPFPFPLAASPIPLRPIPSPFPFPSVKRNARLIQPRSITIGERSSRAGARGRGPLLLVAPPSLGSLFCHRYGATCLAHPAIGWSLAARGSSFTRSRRAPAGGFGLAAPGLRTPAGLPAQFGWSRRAPQSLAPGYGGEQRAYFRGEAPGYIAAGDAPFRAKARKASPAGWLPPPLFHTLFLASAGVVWYSFLVEVL